MEARLGTGSYTWSTQGLPLVQALRDIATLGIRHVDVVGDGHGCPETLTAREQQAAKAALDDLGLVASSLLAVKRGINIAAQDDVLRRRTQGYFEAILDFASVLGTRQICLMAGEKVIDLPNEAAWENAVSLSKDLARRCRERGLFVTYELEWRTCGLVQTVAEMDRLIAAVDEPNVLANVDVGHVALARDGRVELQQIAPKTIHIHVNDNDTVLHTNALPGDGVAPIERFVRILLESGAPEAAARVGEVLVAAIEIEDAAHTGQPAVELIRRSRDWMLEHLPEVEL